MDLDLDYELRFALFAHIGGIVERTGIVTSVELNAGLIFHGERVPIWNQQKGIFRPAIRLRHVPLLDAAHILPDRDPRGNPEVPNGLALPHPPRRVRRRDRRRRSGIPHEYHPLGGRADRAARTRCLVLLCAALGSATRFMWTSTDAWMDPEFEARLDSKLEIFARHFELLAERMERLERRMGGLETRMEGLETRMGGLETRMDGLETRMDGFESRMDRFETRLERFEKATEERFLGMADRFRVVESRLESVQAGLTDLRAHVSLLNVRLEGVERRFEILATRGERIEQAVNGLDERVSGFADDVRQRFRVVNDRLVAIAS